MKIKIRYILSIFLMWSIFFTISFSYEKEKINFVDIELMINDDGSANITQVWDIETVKGTEFYITMSKMGDMKVQDFIVEDEAGKPFTFVGNNWDINASLEEKAYKCGFHTVDDGFEMCWGKGSYGKHTYTVKYKLTNLVKSYPDYDGFNTRLINDKNTPDIQSAKVTVKFSEKSKNTFLNEKNVGIWAFGYKGSILFKNEKVVAASDEPIGFSNYLNVMMRFKKGLINPISQGKGSFNELKDIAFKSSDYKKSENSKNWILGIILACVTIYLVANEKSKLFLKWSFIRMGGKIKGTGYSRNLPMKGNLATTIWALECVGQKIQFNNILYAYIMKLIQNHSIKIVPYKDLDTGAESFEILFDFSIQIKDDVSKKIFDILVDGIGPSNKITEYELKKHLEKKSMEQGRSISSWLSYIKYEGNYDFHFNHIGYDGFDKNIFTRMKIKLLPIGFELIQQMFDFKKFLKDFTLIAEKNMDDLALWDDYLIFATLFNMTDNVAKQMKNIDPNFEKSSILLGEHYFLVDRTVYSLSKMYKSAKDASEGKGGSSSSGGGSGYSGGGSGSGSR